MNRPGFDADDLARLHDMAREFTEGFNSGDVGRIMQFYGDTYVDVNLRHPVQSKQERAAYYREVIRRGLRVDVQPDEILVEGNLAFVRGSIKLMQGKTLDARATELRYLEIARKEKDGSWKVMWGMDGPVQEYDPND